MDFKKELYKINLEANILGVSYFYQGLLEEMKSKGSHLSLDDITSIKNSTIKGIETKDAKR